MSNTESPDYTFESATAFLASICPKGVSILAGGAVIDLGKVEKITDLKRMSDIARAPKDLVFDLHGTQVSIQLRGLLQDEIKVLDNMPAPIAPKVLKKDGQGRPQTGTEVLDFEDPTYLGKRREHYELKRAIVIAKGLVDVVVPGDNADDQKKNLAQMFPPNVLELMMERILSLSTVDITFASFT